MKLRTRERYSLRMMMAIAKLSSETKPVGLNEVSRHSGISRRYLEQLVPALKNAGLLRALSGRGGGYMLAKKVDEIKLGDILVAAIGPIAVTECAVGAGDCLQADYCNCKGLWELINYKIVQILSEYTLADLTNENWLAMVRDHMV